MLVAADAEFAVGRTVSEKCAQSPWAFSKVLGATMMLAKDGLTQVSRVFGIGCESRRLLIVSLKGRRSRKRRHLRPRTGCVRALMDVALETFASVALLPVALPYQLVPEVHSNGRFACSVDSRMHLVWRACHLEAQDSRALTKSLTLTSTKGVHRKSLSK